MNQSFNLHRFGLLVRKHWVEHYRQYSFSIFVLAGLMALWYVVVKPGADQQRVLYVATLLLAGGVYTATTFQELHSPGQGIGYLMLPASRVEKIAVAFLFSLLFLPVALGLYYGITSAFVAYFHRLQPVVYPDSVQFSGDRVAQLFVGAFFLVHAAGLLGSLTFPRQTFIRSAAVVLVVLVGLFYVNEQLAEGIIADDKISDLSAVPFYRVGVEVGATGDQAAERGQFYNVALPYSAQRAALAFIGFTVVALWWISYVRLKEKEI